MSIFEKEETLEKMLGVAKDSGEKITVILQGASYTGVISKVAVYADSKVAIMKDLVGNEFSEVAINIFKILAIEQRVK